MRFAIVIFGLVASLSAQVVCQPVDSNGRVDIASLDSATTFKIDIGWHVGANNYLVTDYPMREVRCHERLHGTIALGNGKIVHSAWIGVTQLDRWMADSGFCSAARSKEPLYRFLKEIREGQLQETEVKPVTIPTEFCKAVDR